LAGEKKGKPLSRMPYMLYHTSPNTLQTEEAIAPLHNHQEP
jgi:hypothetical protein